MIAYKSLKYKNSIGICGGCGNQLVFTKRDIGNIALNKTWKMFVIKNFPHISCVACSGVIHINDELKEMYDHLYYLGLNKARGMDYFYVIDFKKEFALSYSRNVELSIKELKKCIYFRNKK